MIELSDLMISLLLPTRGRPDLVARLFKSICQTASLPEQLEVIVYADEDDPSSHEIGSDSFTVKTLIGPTLSMGECNTRCLEEALGEIIILANDDMVIRTLGWDKSIINLHRKLEHGIYLAYPNDLDKKGGLCTFPILSRRLCALLGSPYPKQYAGGFIDWHLHDIFIRLEKKGYPLIHYLEDIVFEHLHFRNRQAPMDETYRKRKRFEGDEVFIALTEERREIAAGLYKLLEEQDTNSEKPLSTAVKNPQIKRPSSIRSAFASYTKVFLLDQALPLRWRIHLWARTFARYLAGRGLLKPFY